MLKNLLLSALVTLSALAYGEEELILVRPGASDYEIVLPEAPSSLVDYAAEELQYHLAKSTGVKLPVTRENRRTPGKKAIYLAATRATVGNLPENYTRPNGFSIMTLGDDLYIFGDDEDGSRIQGGGAKDPAKGLAKYGTLFGVYEFLEQVVGVRWIWPGELGELIPKHETIRIGKLNIQDAPKLLHSRLRYNPTRSPGGWESASERKKFIDATWQWLIRHRVVRAVSLEYGHAYENYWKRFSAAHLDFFNLLPDGKRYSDAMYCGGANHMISMCVSNPAFQDKVVEEWAKNRSPFESMVNCAENDTNGKCVCPRCMALDRANPDDGIDFANREMLAKKDFLGKVPGWEMKLGSLSDRYATFYNAVLAKAKKIDPEAMVLGYSYVNYSKPPMEVKLSRDIVLGVVPQLIFPWTNSKREEFRRQWDGWAKAGAQLYLRPNYTLDGHNFPIYYADEFAEDFQYAWNRNLYGTDFDSLIGQYATQGPNHYVNARMQLHGDWDKEKVLDEYYSIFGPASDAVRAYFGYWKELSMNVDEKAFINHFDAYNFASFIAYFKAGPQIFTPAVFARGFALLEVAEQAAKGDEAAAKRVAFLKNGLRNAELTAQAQAAFERYEKDGDAKPFAAALNRLDSFRASIESEMGCDFTFLAFCENYFWDRDLVRMLAVRGNPLQSDWMIRFDPDKTGEKDGLFRPDAPKKGWQPIKVGEFYNRQKAGTDWKKSHNNQDFTGISYYKTKFKHDKIEAGTRYLLTFGAVDEECKVYLNGKLLVDRPFPYLGNTNSWQEPFDVDLTDALIADGENDLTIMVLNLEGAGGIWKPVFFSSRAAEPDPEYGKRIYLNRFDNGKERWYAGLNTPNFIAKPVLYGGVNDSAALFLECAVLDDQGKSWGRWILESTPVEKGALYQVRMRYKTSADFQGSVKIWVRPGQGEFDFNGGSTKGEWRDVVISNYPATENMIHLYVNIWNGTGSLMLDDVEIIRQNQKLED